MFRRKLQALALPVQFNAADEKSFRNLVILLEDTKIRQYKIEDRTGLRAVDSDEWPAAFEKYLEDVNCPRTNGTDQASRVALVDWLLMFALSLEYSDNPDEYNAVPEAASSSQIPSLDLSSSEVQAAINELATLLKVPTFLDMPAKIHAITKRIEDKFTPAAIAVYEAQQKERVQKLSLDKIPVGFEISGIVREPLPHGSSRSSGAPGLGFTTINLTRVNEAIVSAQMLTYNPKVDTRLGAVGF